MSHSFFKSRALKSLFGVLLLASGPLYAAQVTEKQKTNVLWNAGKKIAAGAVLIYLSAHLGKTHLPALADEIRIGTFGREGEWFGLNTSRNQGQISDGLNRLAGVCSMITTKTNKSARYIFTGK